MPEDVYKLIDQISCRRAFFDLLKGKSTAATTPEHTEIIKNLQQTNGLIRNENGRMIASGDNEFAYFSSTLRYEGGKAKLITTLDVGAKGKENNAYSLSWTVTGTPKGNEECCNPNQMESVESISLERYKGRALLSKMNLAVEAPMNEAELLKRYLSFDISGLDELLEDKSVKDRAEKVFADMRRDNLKTTASRTVIGKDSRGR